MKYFGIILLWLVVPLNAATIIPRSGTTSQLHSTVGINGEIAVDNTTKNIVIYDGKTMGGFYTGGSSVTVKNTYNYYTTSNTITNNTTNYYITYANLSSTRTVDTGGNFTTSSSGFVWVSSITIITHGSSRIIFGTNVMISMASPQDNDAATLYIDGINQGGTSGLSFTTPHSNGVAYNMSFTYMSDYLPAGTHILSLWVRSGGNSEITVYRSSVCPLILWVQEII